MQVNGRAVGVREELLNNPHLFGFLDDSIRLVKKPRDAAPDIPIIPSNHPSHKIESS